MKQIKFNAKCDQTIERFKKKTIVAICVESDSRLNSSDKLSIAYKIMEKNGKFTYSRFSTPLYKAVAEINGMSVMELLLHKDSVHNQFVTLAKLYKESNINHFVNIWIEKNYDEDFIIVDAKFIEQYGFLYNINAFIIKVNSINEIRDFNQPTINCINKPNFVLSLEQIDDEEVINTLCKKIQSFKNRKERKTKMPKIKVKRKRIIKN